MRQLSGRHGVLAAVMVLAVPLALAATAFACGSLATLRLNRATARSGQQLTAFGGNFNSSPKASTVQVRFNSRNGRVLWEGRPTAAGRFTADFAAPDARPGYYVVVATQTGPDGRPAAGTPGRAPLRLRTARGSRATAVAPGSPWAAPGGGAAPPRGGAPSGLVALIGVGALGAAGAIVAGLALLRPARRRRLDVARSLS